MLSPCKPCCLTALLFFSLATCVKAIWVSSDESTRTVTVNDVCVPPTIFDKFGNDTSSFKYTEYVRTPQTAALGHAGVAPGATALEHMSHVNLLQRIYQQPLVLSNTQLKQGISGFGDPTRLHSFTRKLVSGQPVTIVILGGSISVGHGTLNHYNSYPNRFFRWILTTFPHAKHQLLNKAIPAVGSSFVGPCVQTMLPPDTDLVLLEFSVNDQYDDSVRVNKAALTEGREAAQQHLAMDAPGRRGMERMVRNLWSFESQPAIMYLHTYTGNPNFTFYEGVEDMYTTIFNYYGVPSLSQRNALHRMVQDQPELLQQLWYKYWDPHPTCIGTRFLADLLIGFLQDIAAAEAWAMYLSRHHPTHPQIVLPTAVQVAQSQLPSPIFAGNGRASREGGDFSTKCLFTVAIIPYIAGGVGWTWMDETHKNKWGFVSEAPGNQITVRVPLKEITFDGKHAVVGLGMLVSDAPDMGVAKITCMFGCSCEEQTKSFLNAYKRISMTYWDFLRVEVVPFPGECIVVITNSPQTQSQGHKLKLADLLFSGNLLVSEAILGAAETGFAEISVNKTIPKIQG